ncbi:MAG: carbon storage regulator [Maioricimonas sp. JB049]
MLVLTRKIGEEIVIDGEIVVKVSEIQGNRVKLCIEAPRSRRILRGEVAERAGVSPAPQPNAVPRPDDAVSGSSFANAQ